jgi:hypothetical protein
MTYVVGLARTEMARSSTAPALAPFTQASHSECPQGAGGQTAPFSASRRPNTIAAAAAIGISRAAPAVREGDRANPADPVLDASCRPSAQ